PASAVATLRLAGDTDNAEGRGDKVGGGGSAGSNRGAARSASAEREGPGEEPQRREPTATEAGGSSPLTAAKTSEDDDDASGGCIGMGEGVGDADVSVIDAAAVVISTSGNDGHLPRGNAASGNNVTNGVRLADSGPAIGEKDGTDSGKQVDSGDAIGGIDGGKSAADRSGDIPAPQADTGMECVGNVDSETEAHWKQRADTPVVVTDGSTGSEKLGQPGDDAGRDGGSTDEYEGCREAGGCDGIGVQNRAEVSGKARGTALQHPVSGSDPTIVKNSGGGPTG
ncbi:hypothetical protein PPTG_20476, partial [Phytophthora nicotianae INRA-310]